VMRLRATPYFAPEVSIEATASGLYPLDPISAAITLERASKYSGLLRMLSHEILRSRWEPLSITVTSEPLVRPSRSLTRMDVDPIQDEHRFNILVFFKLEFYTLIYLKRIRIQ
jgi:hypothetical protein